MSILYAKVNKMCAINCIKFDHVSCVFFRRIALFMQFNELCLEHVLEIAWCVNILLALSSLLQYICRCLCTWGCSACWVYEKILLDQTMMFLVWWSTISDYHHNVYTGTWLRGDPDRYLEVTGTPAIVLFSRNFLASPTPLPKTAQLYLYFLEGVNI